MLSACSVLGACFVVANCHKRPRLITSFYGISRNNATLFVPLVPQVTQIHIPLPVVELLVSTQIGESGHNKGISRSLLVRMASVYKVLHTVPHSPIASRGDPCCNFAAHLSASIAWGTIKSYLSAMPSGFIKITTGLNSHTVKSEVLERR